jgi:hypothetical protein
MYEMSDRRRFSVSLQPFHEFPGYLCRNEALLGTYTPNELFGTWPTHFCSVSGTLHIHSWEILGIIFVVNDHVCFM